MPIYAIYVEKIGGNLLDIGLAGGVFALAGAVTAFITGRYSDKIKESEFFIVFSYAFMGVGFLLYMIVDSIFSLLLVQILIGISRASYGPAFDALYSRHLHLDHAGKTWGAWESMSYLATAIGATIGGIIAFTIGFNALFIAMAALCFFSAIYIFFLPREIL